VPTWVSLARSGWRAIVLLTGDDGASILDEVAAILYDLPLVGSRLCLPRSPELWSGRGLYSVHEPLTLLLLGLTH